MFEKQAFLDNMRVNNRDSLIKYEARISEGRSLPQISEITIEFIEEYATLKDIIFQKHTNKRRSHQLRENPSHQLRENPSHELRETL